MPRFGPITRRDLIQTMRKAGFVGPLAGSRHQFMMRGDLKIAIPNPHRGDISKGLLAQILREAGISRQDWERL